MALAFFDDDIVEVRKQRMVKNLAKPGNCSLAVKFNLKMKEIKASKVGYFGSIKSLQFFKAFNLSRFPVITKGNMVVK